MTERERESGERERDERKRERGREKQKEMRERETKGDEGEVDKHFSNTVLPGLGKLCSIVGCHSHVMSCTIGCSPTSGTKRNWEQEGL